MVKPLFDYIQIKPIEEDGVLKIVNNQYVIAHIVQLPGKSMTDNGVDYWLPDDLEEGAKVLCFNVDDFMIGGEKTYFVKAKSIIAIL